MIPERKNFQKVYELKDRLYPEFSSLKIPTESENSNYLIISAINSLGFATEKEITYYKCHNRIETKKEIKKLLEDKKIVEIKIEDLQQTYYTTEKILNGLKNYKKFTGLHILNPFDNLIIQRERAKNIFNFDYTIECYVPAEKRKYGYYVLPILYGDKFIGRIDAKADRKNKEFLVYKIFTEGNKRLI